MLSFLVAFALFYLYHGLGITLGYHRLLAHRSFRVSKLFEYLLASGAYLSLEGAPIFWVTTHRLHHRYSDQPGDPHSPKDGLVHAFIGWMARPKVKISEDSYKVTSPDLYRDPVYRLLHCQGSGWDGLVCLAASILFRVIIYVTLGPIALAGNLAATLLAFLSPLLVNSVCHLPQFGYRSFPVADQSRNVWFVALLSLGEGWHNNHHAIPRSARHGMDWWEFDLSWLALKILSFLGIVTEISLPKDGSGKGSPPGSPLPVNEPIATEVPY